MDPRRGCFVCKKKTRWQCLKCHYYFCVTTQAKDYWYLCEKVSIEKDENITRILRKSCYHKHHFGAIQAGLNSVISGEE